MAPLRLLGRASDLLASVKLAVPLLIAIAFASILGTLIPQGKNVRPISTLPGAVRSASVFLQLNDIFHSWWYLLLLALLALSLVLVTVKRVPRVWKARGRTRALSVLLAHAGTVVILGGAIYGGVSGFREYTRVIEGEATVIPHVPMVIKLERLDLVPYAPESFGRQGRGLEKQDSVLTLLHHGRPFLRAAGAPGNPLSARGVTLLPSERDLGWVFDLVLAAGGHERVVTIRPWAPPLITLGLGNESRIMAHRLGGDGKAPAPEPWTRPSNPVVEVFLLEKDGTSRSLGLATEGEPLGFGAWTITVANLRRYTGLHVYARPEIPFLVAGAVVVLVGLGGYLLSVTTRVWPHARRLTPRVPAGVPPISEPDGELSHVASS